jgi:hypothetical protein
MRHINYALLKTEGRLIGRHSNVEVYALGNRVYRATYYSIGGFAGSAGYKIKDITCREGGETSDES